MTARGRSQAAPVPLLWNVAGLLGEPAGSVRDYAVEGISIEPGEDLRLARPIDGQVHLARTNRGLLVDAGFRTALAMECARCLREIEVPIEIEIREEAIPSVDLHSGLPVASAVGEDEVLRLTDHHELDLEQTVREGIQLAEPIAPLCRDDCPGLCAVCGERLDDGTHDHPDEDIDPRLEALRSFRPEG